MLDIQATQKVIREENLAGWLFSNIFHRDEISDLILRVHGMNTRPWACIVFPDRPPLKIVHTIEAGILEEVPGKTSTYGTREEYLAVLSEALPRGLPIAAQFSTSFPIASFFDHGMGLLLERAGILLVPSENLIARTLGSLDEEGIRSHERAAGALYRIVRTVWHRVVQEVRAGKTLRETEVRSWIESLLAERGLEWDSPPLVAAGRGSSDPHYTPQGDGEPLGEGEVVQLDIWAKERSADAVYADISWVGVVASEPRKEIKRVFDAVVQAREAAVSLLRQRLEARAKVSGADVDRAARARLSALGFERGVRHRTGHSIGTRVHGFGVNLDSVEFPDERPLREGACFSIEPGIYLDGFGMRTEIDAYILDGRLVVSGEERQERLLVTE